MAQSTLIKRGQAWGCSNVTISRRHICLPHDGTWMAHLPPMLAFQACLLLTSTYPRSPSCWYVYLHDGPSWPSSRSWQLGPSELMSVWMCTAVARMHNYDDECVGCVQ